LKAAQVQSASLQRQIELLQQSTAELQMRCVAAESSVTAVLAERDTAIAAAEPLRQQLYSAQTQLEQALDRQHQEVIGAKQQVAAADLSVAFLRSISKGKDDTIKLLRSEYEVVNSKLGQALANEAAFTGLKIALHEANAQRASLMKTISESQNKISELMGECDALKIAIAQLEKERDGLVDEIHEYRQVLAIADSKINEYEALHAGMMQPSSSSSSASAAAAHHVPRAWNLSEPAKAVQQTDTYVLQSSPVKSATAKTDQDAAIVPASPEVDEYDDMLQVRLLYFAWCGCTDLTRRCQFVNAAVMPESAAMSGAQPISVNPAQLAVMTLLCVLLCFSSSYVFVCSCGGSSGC
jgi:predicted  nucleic acid-binding Zn-ribbon protein